MNNKLKNLQDTFKINKQIKLVSFSVMPWVNSVKKLSEYGAAAHKKLKTEILPFIFLCSIGLPTEN